MLESLAGGLLAELAIAAALLVVVAFAAGLAPNASRDRIRRVELREAL